ncbi:MAG: hypothetical protein KME46_34100 [Brasilonema angustatum HA4187-MV1]|jgi:hypothetical protein|nr:hypothetical protein [Brasilonema angustatum HA4187-MV1]
MINHRTLSGNALPIGITSFVLAAGAAAFSAIGYFDGRVKYCDHRVEPCKTFVTLTDYAPSPDQRLNQFFIPGNGKGKLVASVLGLLASTIAIASCNAALRKREEIDSDDQLQETEERNKAAIQSDLRTQIAAIEADAQIKLHTKLTYDATAEMYVDASPELVEDIVQQRAEARKQAEIEAEEEERSVEQEVKKLEAQQPEVKIPPTPENSEHYIDVGSKVLDKLGTLTQSSILISSPGAGKTTTIGTAWGRMKKRLGENFHATVIIYKAKDKTAFEGIADEVLCFPEQPETAVLAILQFVEDMKLGSSTKTRRLFIDDFLTIWGEIQALYKNKFLTSNNEFTYKKTDGKASVIDWLISQLNAVFLVGRESNNALWISSHSPNVEDLPFVASKGARISGNLLFLARQDPQTGNGNYEVISQNINNHQLISESKQRETLKALFPGLTELSQQSGEPIILTSHGSNGAWEMGIISDRIREEYEQYRQHWSTPVDNKVDSAQPKSTSVDNKVNPHHPPTTQPLPKGELMKSKLRELVGQGAALAEIMKELWNVTEEDDQRYKLGLEFVQKMASELGLELPKGKLSDIAIALIERLKEKFPNSTNFNIRDVNRAFSSWNGKKISADDLRALLQEIIEVTGTGGVDGNTFTHPLD